MNGLVRRAARIVMAVTPRAVPHTVARVLFFALAQQPPRVALRDLLEVESELARRQNEAASRYDHGVHVKHRLTRYHDFFAERICATERVLDIGCGIGAVAATVAKRTGAEVLGIDLSGSSIRDARARYTHPRLRFVHGDALRDLEPQPFDVVVLSNVLEHIDRRVAFLRAVRERFSPRRWLIRVPTIDRDWRVPLRQELGLLAFNDPTHYVEYTRPSFECELSEAGLSIVHLQVNWGEIWAEARAADA
jgi:2-polyprenyl-3-methyl-5-hydroxy-6-metoxy-1,4-benzoquinol methylase